MDVCDYTQLSQLKMNATNELDVVSVRWMVSQWSSLACHPIVDDDAQSAWQIISNLSWAITISTVTSRTRTHGYTHTHTASRGWRQLGVHCWAPRMGHQQSFPFRVTLACVITGASLGCSTIELLFQKLHTLCTHSQSRAKADASIPICVKLTKSLYLHFLKV